MLNKTIVLAIAAAISLAGTGPSPAKLVAADPSIDLRPAFAAAGNWLPPVDVPPLRGTLAASGNAFGQTSATVLEASVELDPGAVADLPAPPAVPTSDYGLFGSVALPIATLPATRQWLSVSATDFTAQYGARCHTAACTTGVGALLAKAARMAASEPTYDGLSLVNNSVNTLIRYRADRDDHWATPVETAARGTGDCEDFAIAKMWLLRSIGYTPDELQLVVLKDTSTGAFHAVLAVHVGGRRYILDNMSSTVRTDAMLKNYVPIESFSGSKSFIHGFARDAAPAPTLTASIEPAS